MEIHKSDSLHLICETEQCSAMNDQFVSKTNLKKEKNKMENKWKLIRLFQVSFCRGLKQRGVFIIATRVSGCGESLDC